MCSLLGSRACRAGYLGCSVLAVCSQKPRRNGLVCVCETLLPRVTCLHVNSAGECGTCILPHSTKLWMQVGSET